jgi:hypothetical protein
MFMPFDLSQCLGFEKNRRMQIAEAVINIFLEDKENFSNLGIFLEQEKLMLRRK